MLNNISQFLKKKTSQNQESRQILGNIVWLVGDKGFTLALSLIVGVFLARYLGPEQFGIYNYALAFAGIFSTFSTLGLNGIVVKDLVELSDQEGEILGTSMNLRFMGSTFSIVCVLVVMTIFPPHDNRITPLILIFSLINIVSAFQTVSFYFESKVLSKYIVTANFVSQLFYTLTIFGLIFFKASLLMMALALVSQSIINSGLVVIIYLRSNANKQPWIFSWRRAKSLLSRSWPLILSSLGAVIYLKIDQIMLGQMRTDAEVGIYSVAVRFSEVWYFLPNFIVASYFPSLLKTREKNYQEYENKLQKMYDALMGLALVLSIVIVFISSPLINFLYGNSYQDSSLILSIHIWASIFIFMRALLSKWLIAEDLYIFSFVTHTSGAIVNVLLNLFLIPIMGGKGAAIATVVSYSFASYFSLFFHSKTIVSAKMMTIALFAPFRYFKKPKF